MPHTSMPREERRERPDAVDLPDAFDWDEKGALKAV